MPCSTFVNDATYIVVPNVAGLQEWIPLASKAIGKRIAVESHDFVTRSLFKLRRKKITLYSLLIDIGYGEAQIINFAPRDGSDWSINHYVPAQEVAAWAMGVVAGCNAKHQPADAPVPPKA